MSNEAIQKYAKDQNLHITEAMQVFLQALVLKHLSLPGAHFMGGTALVMGYGNPRFSEDIDLTQVKNPLDLAQGLKRAAKEASQWLDARITLKEPKKGSRTWKMSCPINPAQTVRLHIDTQPFRAYTTRPIVIEFPSLTSFVCDALTIEEILAEKMLALAYRKYLGGRDLFDLWFHWLRRADWNNQSENIYHLMQLKLKERKLNPLHFQEKLKKRIFENVDLKRARLEWKRYLPNDFQKESIFKDIIECHHKLESLFSNGTD